jgi:hypothetical protein
MEYKAYSKSLGKQVGKLVWINHGKSTTIFGPAPFPLLQRERQRVKKNYPKGSLKIQYTFT